MSLTDAVRRTLARHHLAGPDTRVVVAFSGGPDSTALLHVLRELAHAGDLRLVGAAHLNHGLRAAAPEDECHCAEVAGAMGLPFAADRIDVRALAQQTGRSIEDAAHHARTAFFSRAAEVLRADVVAVGHTKDDQAETFLLRLIRGAGSRGLAAMYPRSGVVIRPLLECSKRQVRAFLNERALSCLHDETNDDVGIPRNRVRAELLPLLVQRFNPQVVNALAAAAALARADEALIRALTAEWTAAHVERPSPGTWRVDSGSLATAPQAIGFRALHDLMSQASAGRPIGLGTVLRGWSVVTGERPRLDGPGLCLERHGGYVVLTSRPAGPVGRHQAVSAGPAPSISQPLPIPGELVLPEWGQAMSAEVMHSAHDAPLPNGATAVVPKVLVADGLAVRTRRAGDRVRVPAGHRKLQDLFVDRKVPRGERDRIPIVTTADDRIVWVAGHVLDPDFRVIDPAQAVVVLRLKGVGGSC
ncbi:MAG: tRNA lysidine(34) synthetase TilS [Acidobacteria bacterium]|nr:tRNA lysidine(34) synthetase TilS [Acidobacteriota bacterium]